MTMRLLHRADHKRMAWANGSGVTHEVARRPIDPATEFTWRVSMAEVSVSGPFSALPGIDRVILLLEGSTMHLTIDGERVDLGRVEPHRFAGEAVTTCRIPEPSRDLNVMTRRGAAASEVEVITATVEGVPVPNGAPELLVVAADGAVTVSDGAGAGFDLTDGDAVHVDDGSALRLGGTGTAVVIRIHPAP